jgi:hypothetical protein
LPLTAWGGRFCTAPGLLAPCGFAFMPPAALTSPVCRFVGPPAPSFG